MLEISDIRDAGLLAVAAYDNGTTAAQSLEALGLTSAGWQYVNPNALDTNAQVDANGYFSNDIVIWDGVVPVPIDPQALLAYNSETKTLAISFRGTTPTNTVDWYDDLIGGTTNFGDIYSAFSGFVSTVIANAASLGATRILVTGHSLGGAMVEEALAQFRDDDRLVGVSFASPGVQNISSDPGSDTRLINIGHVDPLGNGDPVYRATEVGSSFVSVEGTDIHVDLPDLPDESTSIIAAILTQHDRYLYAYTATKIANELDKLSAIGDPIDPRVYNYVIGTDWSILGVLVGTLGNDVIIGDARANATSVTSRSRNDILSGSDGNDILDGGLGNDIISGGPGNDILNGADGTDTAVFQLALGNPIPGQPGKFDGYYTLTWHGTTVTVTAKPGTPSVEGTDTLSNVELLQFSDQTINIILDLADLSGQTTTGGRPTDGGTAASGATVSGDEAGTGGAVTGETRIGTDASEYLGGTSGPDVLRGMGGDDVLTGYAGQDTFDGGLGSDTVDYSYEPASVSGTVDLAAGTATFPGFYTEQLTSIENVWMGAGNDNIAGDGGPNDLRGGPGNDTLNGGLGNDVIYGDWKYSDQGGIDTAILSYTFGSGYTVSGSANALHIVGAEGDDWYYNIENFQFASGVTKSGELLLQAAQWAPVQVGSEIQVSPTKVYSYTEAVAALNDGGFLATWSFRNSDSSISGMGGQRFDADGSKVGNEFEYQFSGASYSVATAVLDDGTSVVVWNNGQILGQRLSASGTPIGPEFQVSSVHGGDYPATAFLEDGKFVVTWHSFGSGGNEIFGQRFNADGSKAGSEFLVSDGGLLDFGYGDPSVAALQGGGFAISSNLVTLSGSDEILVKRYDAGGVFVGSNVVSLDSSLFDSDSSITGLSDGGYVVTWSHGFSDYDLYARQYHADGTPVGDKFVVNSHSGDVVYNASIVGMSDEGYIITWTYDVGHDEFGYSVYGQRFSADGTRVGDEFRINTTGQSYEYYPSVVQLGDSDVAVTWTNGAVIKGQIFSLVNQKPNASDDTIATSEDAPVSGNVLVDNAHGADSDPDGDALSVTGVNGATISFGQSLTLASGALLVVNPDGRFVYDPNGQFESLNVGETANDSFTYTISDGQGHTATATATVTITGAEDGLQIANGSGTINGTVADDQIAGGPGNEIIHGGAGYDWLQGGPGADQLFGEDGSDYLEGGDGNDTLSGGAGYNWLLGGAGDDTAVYSGNRSSYTVTRDGLTTTVSGSRRHRHADVSRDAPVC